MFAGFMSVGTLFALSLLFSVVTFAAGCAVGAWFFRFSTSNSASESSQVEQDTEAIHSVERAMMATRRIQDLARHIVSHVGDHGSKVAAFDTHLKAMAAQPSSLSTETLLLVVGQMTCANTELQQRLTQIEKQVESQAAELKCHSSEARTDSLTGLANRRAFDDEIQRRFAVWQRRRTPFSLLILDVDNFKTINDLYGHLAGDEALRQIGKVIASQARQMDFCCRYGGDEFVVILPDTSIRETGVAGERIRKAIESTRVTFGDNSYSLTCSIGAARITTSDDVANLIHRADSALYKSKETGRNCGYWHEGDAFSPLASKLTTDSPPDAAPTFESLADREAMVDALHRRLPESQRFGIPLSVIHLRLANYPMLCRTYGESHAHTMLDTVTAFTQLALRQIDLLARLDDGELVVLLPGSTRNEANQIAKRLRMSAANCDAQLKNERVPITLIHGIAELRPNDTAESIMARARSVADAEVVPTLAVS